MLTAQIERGSTAAAMILASRLRETAEAARIAAGLTITQIARQIVLRGQPGDDLESLRRIAAN